MQWISTNALLEKAPKALRMGTSSKHQAQGLSIPSIFFFQQPGAVLLKQGQQRQDLTSRMSFNPFFQLFAVLLNGLCNFYKPLEFKWTFVVHIVQKAYSIDNFSTNFHFKSFSDMKLQLQPRSTPQKVCLRNVHWKTTLPAVYLLHYCDFIGTLIKSNSPWGSGKYKLWINFNRKAIRAGNFRWSQHICCLCSISTENFDVLIAFWLNSVLHATHRTFGESIWWPLLLTL